MRGYVLYNSNWMNQMTSFLEFFDRYRWAFTGDSGSSTSEVDRRRLRDQAPTFVPHVIRLSRRIVAKVTSSEL